MRKKSRFTLVLGFVSLSVKDILKFSQNQSDHLRTDNSFRGGGGGGDLKKDTLVTYLPKKVASL